MRQGIIYKVTCIENGNFLYGSTLLKLRIRKSNYLCRLKKGNYKNYYLQRCFNKYGEDSLVWTIVQENIPEDKLQLVEDEWINKNNSRAELKMKGMNLKGAFRPNHSEETRYRISIAKKGKKQKPDHYNNIIKSFNERKERGEIKLWNKDIIEKRVKSRLKNNKPISENTRIKMSIINKGRKFKNRWRKVYQFSLDGLLINEFESITLAQNETGIPGTLITSCCKGRNSTSGKFIWSYTNICPLYNSINKRDNIIYSIYKNIIIGTKKEKYKKISEVTGINIYNVYNIIRRSEKYNIFD